MATFLLLSGLILMGDCLSLWWLLSMKTNTGAYPGCVLPQVASFVADRVIVFSWTQKLHLLDNVLPFLFRIKIKSNKHVLHIKTKCCVCMYQSIIHVVHYALICMWVFQLLYITGVSNKIIKLMLVSFFFTQHLSCSEIQILHNMLI